MALHFIIGKSGYGKTHYCMDKILKSESSSNKQVLIVPEQFTSQAERDLLMLSKNHTLLHSEVLSFGRMAQRMFNNSGIGDRLILDDISKSMALQKILLQEEENLIYFKKFIDKTGFIEQLSLTFSEFAQYNISAKDILNSAKEKGLPIVVQEKLQDLQLIYEKYSDFLGEDYIPKDEKLSLLSSLLTENNMFSNITFYIDGFYELTPKEINVVAKLLQFSKDVYITLPMSKSAFTNDFLPNYSPFFKPYLTKLRLLQITSDIDSTVFLSTNYRNKRDGLLNLEKHFFNSYYENCAISDGVSICSSTTKEKEVISIAGEILYLVKNENIRYKDLAVLTNDLENYAPLFMATLRSFDIPFFIDTKRAISSHPLITMVQSILDLITYNFSYKTMFAYLRTGLSNIAEEEIDILENYALAYGIKSYKWTKNTDWTYGLNPEDESSVLKNEHINRLRVAVITPFLPLIELSKSKSFPFKDLISAIINHMKELKIDEKMTYFRDTAKENNNFEKADEHKQVFNMIFELFSKTNNILGDISLPFIHQQKILLAGISKCQIGVIPPSIDCLIVGDFERSRLPECKYLFVAGVNEGILPAPTTSQGIFTEVERDVIMSMGVEMATSARQLAFHEQLLIYSGLTKPSEKLYLSYFNGDLEGKPFYPSQIINKLTLMDSDLKIETNDNTFDIDKNTPKTTMGYLGSVLENDTLPPLWSNIYNFYMQEPHWESKINILKSAISKNPPVTVLDPKVMQLLYGKKLYSSVSRLERYNSCPFSYFLEYNLKAKPRKFFELQAPDLGNLFHEVLERFFLAFEEEVLSKLPIEDRKDAWNLLEKEPTKTTISKTVKDYVDEIVDDVAKSLEEGILTETASHTYLINRLKRISLTACWTCVRHITSGDFRPIKYELEFGLGQTADLPPIKLSLDDDDELLLTGKIDRIDLYEENEITYAKVVDYKSGYIAFDLSKIYHGLQLQLFVYAGAYINNQQSAKEVRPAGALYFKITDPTVNIKLPEDLDNVPEELYKQLKTKGLVLDDKTSVGALDNTFKLNLASKSSLTIPAKYTAKNEPSKTQSSMADLDSFDNLIKYTNEQVIEIGKNIKKGIIEPNPYKYENRTSCDYCKYKSICSYEYDIFPKFNNISKISKTDFWERVNKLYDKNDDNQDDNK